MRAAAAGVGVTYHGGRLIQNVEVFAFYWGKAWNSDPGLSGLQASMNGFLTDFVSGDRMDLLAEYSANGMTIGRGMFRTPGWIITSSEPDATVDDPVLQRNIPQWIQDLNLDQNANSLFIVFTPPGVTITSGGDRSCDNFCGYHGVIRGDNPTYYAAMPYPCPGGCTGGMGVFDALCATVSHEICEAVTDPQFDGWYDSAVTGNEIGDFCAWGNNIIPWNGYMIQKEWSNNAGACI